MLHSSAANRQRNRIWEDRGLTNENNPEHVKENITTPSFGSHLPPHIISEESLYEENKKRNETVHPSIGQIHR